MRKVLAIAISISAIIFAPFQAYSQGSKRTTLEISVAPTGYMELYKGVARAFMEKYPDIEVKLSGSDTYPNQTQRILRDAMTGTTPDMAHVAYNQIRLLADRKLAVPLESFVTQDKEWSSTSYTAALASMGTVGGKFYAVPFVSSLPAVFYNLNLVERAGGDPKALPQTWTEIIALGKKIQTLGNGTSGIFYLYKNAGWPFQALVLSNGGQLVGADEKSVAFDGASGLEALNLIRDLGRSGMIEMSREQGRQAFAAGKIGILVDASSVLGGFERDAADHFEFAVMPHPIPSPEGRLPAGGNAIVILTSDPAKQRAAWAYAKFASGPVGQTIMVKSSGNIPLAVSAADDPALLKTFYEKNAKARAFLKAVPKMTNWYEFPGDNGNKIVDVIENHMQGVFSQKESPEAALKSMVRDVNILLPR